MSRVKVLIGGEDFAEIRRENYYYVDKTDFLEKFLRTPDDATLFTRPRRFGKTLFLSMLAEFFDITKDSRDLFAGLKVSANEELCREWMNQYPVIFLSLKDVAGESFAEALENFHSLVSDFCWEHRSLLESSRIDTEERRKLEALRSQKADENTLADALLILTRAMRYHHGKPAIVLIDEYDAPLLAAAKQGYSRDMARFMRKLLSSAMKTNWNNFELGVLTGCVRIPLADDYGGLNNLVCHDISDYWHADTLGFTQAEVDTLLDEAGLSCKREEVRDWYDGYRFGDIGHIYCPWTIVNYVRDAPDNLGDTLKAYWLDVSTNAPIRQYIRNRTPLLAKELALLLSGGAIAQEIMVTLNPDELELTADNFWTILYMAGFLTGASEEQMRLSGLSPNPDDDEMALVIPNREIHEFFAEEANRWFRGVVGKNAENSLGQALWEGDGDKFARTLEQVLQTIGGCPELAETWEENCRTVFLTIYCLACYPEICSRLKADDNFWVIQVIDKARGGGFIMEIRRAANEEKNLADLAEEGLGQIEKNRYDAQLLSTPALSVVLHWSVAFCKKTCDARAALVKGA